MAKKKTSRSTPPLRLPAGLQGPVAILIIGLILLFAFAGIDPLGLFSAGETPPLEGSEPPPLVETVPASSSWWEVYFTDPARINDPTRLEGSLAEVLIGYIEQATQSIHIAAFEFNLTPVAEALVRARQRGVEVLWVTDDEHGLEADEEEGHGQFAQLQAAGIEVRDDGRSALMHNKFWIFDGQVVWTGSTNITQNGMFRNNNNVIVIRSSRVAAIFEREFQEMWAGEFGPSSSSTLGQQTATIDGVPVQVLFAAEDEAITRLIDLIEAAQRSIHFMAFSFTHDALGAAMMARAEAGVTVSGIFETRGSETEFSELGALFCAGYPVRQDGNPGTFHHKVIVIDGQTVVTGSLNFSDNANDSNDENVVILSDAAVAGLYLQEFERRWAEAVEPDGAALGCGS